MDAHASRHAREAAAHLEQALPLLGHRGVEAAALRRRLQRAAVRHAHHLRAQERVEVAEETRGMSLHVCSLSLSLSLTLSLSLSFSFSLSLCLSLSHTHTHTHTHTHAHTTYLVRACYVRTSCAARNANIAR